MMKDNDLCKPDMKKSLALLNGSGITLCLLREQDLPLTLSWRNRDDIRFNFKTTGIITREKHDAWWKNYQANNLDFVFIIQETINLQKPVGQISIYNIDLHKEEAEFGRLLIGEKEARGKGLAKEAARLLITWAFRSFQLKRIYLEVLKNNENAIGLYRDCGFSIYREDDRFYFMQIFNSPDVRNG
jgi:diamine N-acetyltransferase